MPFFNDLTLLPPDAILGLPSLFAADPRPCKVNLGIGAYKTAEGASLVLNCVRKAEVQLLQKNLSKDYLPIEGDEAFLSCSLQLLFGSDLSQLNPKNIFAAQTIGGSGALRIAGEFLANNVNRTLFQSQPSWPNHKQIFERAGLNVDNYPYYDISQNKIDFDAMMKAVQNMSQGNIILLHACCHNPTGLDLSLEQWQELSKIIKKRQLIPLFDLAYQGFGQSLDADAQAVRLFAKEGHEMLVCYSFSKNFGLYGERLGFLAAITTNADAAQKVASQIKANIRGNYSTPPLQGARIIKTILKSEELTHEWHIELQNMRERIQEMRSAFIAALLVKGVNKDLSFMHQQSGLFSLLGLSVEQVQRLRQEKGIYMPSNGRINIAGLNTQNIEYVAEAIQSLGM